MAVNVIDEMEIEQKRAAARAQGGNGTFFMLKDGEKALVRPLLNLDRIASILKHDYYNPATKKFEVNAVCGIAVALDEDQCKHCQTAKSSGNKKLLATKYFVIPVWVYSVKNAKGEQVTYFDSEGNEKSVSGLRYLQLKASSDILATLLAMYREGSDITASDLVISRSGESTNTKYTVLPRPASAFTVENIPVQDRESIITRIAELNPPEVVGSTPPAQTASNGTKVAPDF